MDISYHNTSTYTTTKETQVVNHILYYESLEKEFPMLMQLYGLPDVVRSKVHVNARDGTSSLTVANLSTATIQVLKCLITKNCCDQY